MFVLVIVRSQNVSNHGDRGLPQPVLIVVCGKIEHNPTRPFGDVYWQTGYIIKKGHDLAEQGNWLRMREGHVLIHLAHGIMIRKMEGAGLLLPVEA